MQWGDLKEQTLEAIGGITGEVDDEVAFFCKHALDDVHSETDWPWNEKETTVIARAALSGTCTYTKAASTVLLDTGGVASQAIATEYVNGLVELEGGNVYVITAYDYATQTITLSSAIIDASKAAAAGAYQIVQAAVTMGSDVESILDVRDMLNRTRLTGVKERRTKFEPNPFMSIGGDPSEWYELGVDAAGALELGIYPPPSEDHVMQVDYLRLPAYPTNDSDELEAITGIPRRFHSIILNKAKAYAFEYDRENGEQLATLEVKYLRGVAKMKQFCDPDKGVVLQLRSDRRGATRRPPFERNVFING